jgi:hypothetical protein
MTLIVMRGIGDAFVAHGVPRAGIREFLAAELAA